jgi:hypothetical protein
MEPAGFEVTVAADTLHAMNINFLGRGYVYLFLEVDKLTAHGFP